MNKILIIGATSAIAEATARIYAARNDRLYLLARNTERMQTLAADLRVRGAESVRCDTLEVNDFASHEAVIDAAIDSMGGIDLVLIAHGTLSDQKACEQDFSLTLQELNTNAIGVFSLLTHLANHFEAQRHGTIAVISSVAGDRGRQSNYVYGTAKGAVSIFLQGLRNRLYRSGVHVLTIKPGFVDTPMTRKLKKGLLWASPEKVGKNIVVAITKKKNCVYIPAFWKGIMLVIKLAPESIFKRLSI
jgi:decaprenylphospho-beta-D-erythro-pentofuranosid-2-ulose 2-reductase